MPDESYAEKTEQPTPRRRLEVRQKGQVAKSMDLNAAILLLAGLICLYFFGQNILASLGRLTRFVIVDSATKQFTADGAIYYLQNVIAFGIKIVLPIVVVLFTIAIGINIMQIGFVFTGHPLQPDLNKLNPISGLKRLFSKRGLVRLIISLLKVIVVGAVAFFSIIGEFSAFSKLADAGFADVFQYSCYAIFSLGIKVSMALLVLGILDYAFQRWQHEKDIRMTKQELREEMRRMEGDPLMRERRKRIQRQLALQRMMYEAKNADVVITNPQHLAIALQYEVETMNAPKVVAKGAGYMAERIRNVADENDIPIIENKPLTRALYRRIDVGGEVPPDFYKAVAEILAYVYQLDEGKRSKLHVA